jgi:hypothetical protein
MALAIAFWSAIQGVANALALNANAPCPQSEWIVDILRNHTKNAEYCIKKDRCRGGRRRLSAEYTLHKADLTNDLRNHTDPRRRDYEAGTRRDTSLKGGLHG